MQIDMETKVSEEDCCCWGNYEFGNGTASGGDTAVGS